MKHTFLLLIGLMAGLLAVAQDPAPIVVERIYASAGNVTAALDSTQAKVPLAQQYYRVSVHLAQPTYVHRLAFPLLDARGEHLIQAVIDGKAIFELGRRPKAIRQTIQTLDIICMFNLQPQPLMLYRDAVLTKQAGFSTDNLPQWRPIEFTDSNDRVHPIRFPKTVPGRVLASSVEEPATRYHPTCLFDGRDDFGWGTDHGQDGAGESFALSLDAPLTVTRLKLWNGQQGSDSAFRLHPRVRSLLLSNGTDAPQRLVLPDQAGPVIVDLPQALTSTTLQFSIESVYPGQGSDVLVISELQLGDGDDWFTLAPDRDAQHNAFVRAKTKGTTLGDLLDLGIFGISMPVHAENQAQIGWIVHFGSDGSFYHLQFQRNKEPGYFAYIGGWEHFLPQDGVSRVKVWGYRRAVEEYRGGSRRSAPAQPAATYFEADIAIDAFQILPNALFQAIPTRLRYDDLVPCNHYADISEDLRYRTDDNFMGKRLYPSAYCMPCLLRDTTAQALARAQRALDTHAPGQGLRLLIWDAYRPYDVQKAMWAHTPDTNYVANPYTGGSSHNKGLAVDLTVMDATGRPLDMGTKFDDFRKKAHHGYKRLPKKVLANRALLKAVMEAAGFVALPTEWWHYRLPVDLPIADLKFPCPD